MTPSVPITTTVVGSYPQPDWLIDREKLRTRLPPRVRSAELWRIEEPFLEDAQDDATLLAIADMERAGIDVITDGEIRRESYSNRVATALGGIDTENEGVALDRTGEPNPVPRVVGPIVREHPIEVRDVEFLRANTDRLIKITLPGPFTMTQQAEDVYYNDEVALAMDYAKAVNAEIRDLFLAGADVVCLDEPYMQARPEKAQSYAVRAINEALDGIEGTTALHMCFGYAAVHALRGVEKPNSYSFLAELNESNVDQVSIEAAEPDIDLEVLKALPDKDIILGVIDNGTPHVESPELVARRIESALAYVSPERLIVAPDCGMKYLDRWVAFSKLCALVEGAELVRKALV
ncbi:MAG: cobalamin-independent methionine synthase II family protein [Actinomycetota bacterium]|uniref:Cobalamin-independent methionine synthase MetE C-terminal/archaeal domain-containing protein n=1 Tax=marine metagenome TaxID=408172 RepID=A0A381PYZ3_9ZZZZ|nr:cobalamin-independent methionine synthase II family protein [Acidimicrobiales bacterium]MEE3186083.1 cobalamin-independent methionine synthase II family protein [Actinomycetota bacterium]